MELTQLIGFHYQVGLLLHALVQSLTLLQTVELVLVLDNVVPGGHLASLDALINHNIHAWSTNGNASYNNDRLITYRYAPRESCATQF